MKKLLMAAGLTFVALVAAKGAPDKYGPGARIQVLAQRLPGPWKV